MSYAKRRAEGAPVGSKKDLTMIKCMDVYFMITKRMHTLHTTYERLSKTGSQPTKQAAVARAYDELMHIRDKLPCKPEK